MNSDLSSLPFGRFFQLNIQPIEHVGTLSKFVNPYASHQLDNIFFFDRVIHRWNMLTGDVVSASSLNHFKSRQQTFCRLEKDFLLDWGTAKPLGWTG